jgi:hypothetical protein
MRQRESLLATGYHLITSVPGDNSLSRCCTSMPFIASIQTFPEPFYKLRRFVEDSDLSFYQIASASWSPEHNPEAAG